MADANVCLNDVRIGKDIQKEYSISSRGLFCKVSLDVFCKDIDSVIRLFTQFISKGDL